MMDKYKDEIYKKCPYCDNKIKERAVVCQYCHKDLPDTGNSGTNNSSIIPISTVSNEQNSNEKKKCKKCYEKVALDKDTCPKCGCWVFWFY